MAVISDSEIRREILKHIFKMWDDDVGTVRSAAIKTILHLGKNDCKEVLNLIATKRKTRRSLDFEILAEIPKRLNNAKYAQKNELNALLAWCFAKMQDMRGL